MDVRSATDADLGAIRTVHSQAFPTAAEADLVERLHADGDAAVSMVADDGGIVGHMLLSRMRVDADGRRIRALALAPVAVLPERQGQGIGSALVEASLAAAREQGAQIVFLLGEPEYYSRFGFDAATAAPFSSPYAGPYFQALLLDGLSLPASGTAEYAPAFAELG